MSDVQEYYIDGDYVTIWGEVKGKPDTVIVTNGNDYGELSVVDKSRLIKKEDSYQWQQAQKHADELRLITQKAQENLDKLVSKVVDKALLELASRLKFNVLFGKDTNGATAGWVVTISEELQKLVKDKAPEVVKGKEIF